MGASRDIAMTWTVAWYFAYYLSYMSQPTLVWSTESEMDCEMKRYWYEHFRQAETTACTRILIAYQDDPDAR